MIIKISEWIFHNLISYLSDFPRGPVVKNPPANAGDMGSIPGPGRFHMMWSNYAHEPLLLEPVCPEPAFCNKRSHHNEKPAHHS